MSPSPDAAVRLSVSAGSPLAELFLIDRSFALVQRAIGRLQCEVQPGVYKIKAHLADATMERMVVLEADTELDLSGELAVGSAAPLLHTNRASEPAMKLAAAGPSAAPDGAAAHVFVMARGWSDGVSHPTPPAVWLCRPDGAILAEAGPSADDPGAPLVAELDVEPGPLYLRWRDDSEITAEQCVHAAAGWQTQVFVLEEADAERELGRTRVSVLIERDGFDPADASLRLTEQARTALAEERRVAGAFLAEALDAELRSPMLGLYGAHLMLLARDARRDGAASAPARPVAPVSFDQGAYDRLVTRLGDLLGPSQPDVVALRTQMTGAHPAALPTVAAPPMLWRSWVLLIAASNDAPELVPVPTWERTLRLLPLRPYLMWSPAREAPDEWAGGVAQALAVARESAEPAEGSGEASGEDGGPLAQALEAGAEAAAAPGPVDADDDLRRHVSRELLVPRAAIDEVAAGA